MATRMRRGKGVGAASAGMRRVCASTPTEGFTFMSSFCRAGHKNAVLELHWTSDGERVLSASPDKTVRAWDAATGSQVRVAFPVCTLVFKYLVGPEPANPAPARHGWCTVVAPCRRSGAVWGGSDTARNPICPSRFLPTSGLVARRIPCGPRRGLHARAACGRLRLRFPGHR